MNKLESCKTIRNKTLINILSNEILPNFIATMEVAPDCVIALASSEFEGQSEILENLTGTPHEVEPFKPFDFQADFNAVMKLIKEMPSDDDIIINFTGGTKVMSVSAVMGAIAVGRDRDFELIYVDSDENALQRLRVKNGRLSVLKPQVLTISIPFDAYIALNNEKIKSKRNSLTAIQEKRLDIASLLRTGQMNGFFKNLYKFFDDKHLKPSGDFEFQYIDSQKNKRYKGSCSWKSDRLTLVTPKGKKINLEGGKPLEYISGGWLEEYVFSLCRDSGKFDDCIYNVVLSLSDETVKAIRKKRKKARNGIVYTEKNELDVVVTKGVRSAIIECKTGKIKQTDVYKVAALRDSLLGRHGIAVIAARFPPVAGVKEKAKDFRVEMITDIKSVPKRVCQLLGGCV